MCNISKLALINPRFRDCPLTHRGQNDGVPPGGSGVTGSREQSANGGLGLNAPAWGGLGLESPERPPPMRANRYPTAAYSVLSAVEEEASADSESDVDFYAQPGEVHPTAASSIKSSLLRFSPLREACASVCA